MNKLVIAFLLATVSFSTMASSVECNSNLTLQDGVHLKSDATLTFDLEKNGNKSVITNLKGHIFIKADPSDRTAGHSPDDSYRGYFNTPKELANPKYRPNKYKGYAQFNNINAVRTDGQEDGMWGDLSVNVSGENALNAYYVFRAGDHMGGTVVFTCHEEK